MESRFHNPFTIDSLGSGYSINEDNTKIYDNGLCNTILYKNSIPILSIEYRNIENFNQILSSEAYGINVYYENPSEIYTKIADIISINGVQLGDSSNDVKTVFGEPNNEEESAWLWIYKDTKTNVNCTGFFFNDNDELYSFSLILS